jgi:hypothetical protein
MERYQLQTTTRGTLKCNSIDKRYAYGINVVFNIVYAAKNLHKLCDSKLVQYIIL